MNPVALARADDAQLYGGKAAQLAAARRAGLPVPDGLALGHDFVDAVARAEAIALATLASHCAALSGPLAVRSSAIGEDGASASFAGQHATLLNVRDVAQAVTEVWRSARSESALGYRHRIGAEGPVRMGVVVQRLVAAEIAGVMFTRNPITRADELVIEAGWGLGEAIVQGLVVPDFFRLARDGALLERRAGMKTIAIRRKPEGDTEQIAVAPDLVEALSLGDAQLRALAGLAAGCDACFGPVPHDIEWAFADDSLHLLQRRPVTGMRA